MSDKLGKLQRYWDWNYEFSNAYIGIGGMDAH